MLGHYIGNYRLTRLLGEGGMGMVYEAVHEGVGGRAAIKVLKPEVALQKDITARFFNEARAANSISHPGIIHVFDSGYTPDGIAYLTMEFLDGESLRGRLDRVQVCTVMETLRLGHQIASALAAAHQKQVIHRDLKPDNLMLVKDADLPGGERVKILDFGIAKIVETLSIQPLRTRSDMLMGTPRYMAPEQCRGAKHVTDRSDVYSMGIMLYQMLTGSPPFVADKFVDLLTMHVNDVPAHLLQLLPLLDPQVAALIHSMLLKEPHDRPSMADVLRGMLRLINAIASSPTLPPRQSSPSISGNIAVHPHVKAQVQIEHAANTMSARPSGTEMDAAASSTVLVTPTVTASIQNEALGSVAANAGLSASAHLTSQTPRGATTISGDQRPTQPLSLASVRRLAQQIQATSTPLQDASAIRLAPDAPTQPIATFTPLLALEPIRLASSEATTAKNSIIDRRSLSGETLTSSRDNNRAMTIGASDGRTLVARSPDNRTLASSSSNNRTLASSSSEKRTLGMGDSRSSRRQSFRSIFWLVVATALLAGILAIAIWLLSGHARPGGGSERSAADTNATHWNAFTGHDPAKLDASPARTEQSDKRGDKESAEMQASGTAQLPSGQSPSETLGTSTGPENTPPGPAPPKAPPAMDPLLAKAYRAWKKSQFDEASTLATACITAKPDMYQCWWILGLSACNLSRYETIEYAVTHLKLNSIKKLELANEIIAECRTLGIAQASDGRFSRVPAQSEIEAMLRKATYYFRQQKYADALKIAEAYADYEPLQMWEIAGKCACALGMLDRASSALSKYADTSMQHQVIDFCYEKSYEYDYRLRRFKKR